MGVDGSKKTGYGTQVRSAVQTQFLEGVKASAESCGKALDLIQEFIDEEAAKKPSCERPKLSVATLAEGQWVASLADWGGRRAITVFSWGLAQAVHKLAERLCEGGDLWREMRGK